MVGEGSLEGLVVLDMSTMLAAPSAATLLGDYGAEVIKIEEPTRGDHCRRFGPSKDGEPLLWLSMSRNKRCITLNIREEEGSELLKRLVAQSDVLIENFRPGTLERRNLGWDVLSEINPGLVMLRVTGFGQDGPYSNRGGFGTIAEAMSGFAHMTGYPDGPPTLPNFALADGVCGVFGALSVMTAIYERDVKGSGKGQFIDISLYEPLLRLLESQSIQYDQLGIIARRMGNRLADAAPRNAYRTADGNWVALSASAQPIADNVFRAVGRPDMIEDPRFATQEARVKNVEELDSIISEWFLSHTMDDAIQIMRENRAVVGPIYDTAEVYEDPQVKHRQSFVTIEHETLGDVRVPNVHARFSRTPGQVRHLGRSLGADNYQVYGEMLGLPPAEVDGLRDKGVL